MIIYLKLFGAFFKIGAFTFGGGYAMLPLIQEEILTHQWMKMEELMDFVAVSESTPGPFAINIATYVGSETAGFFGAVCSTLGVVLPSFVIILIVAGFYAKFKESRAVKGVMMGLRPATTGLIGAAVFSLFPTVFFSSGVDLSAFLSPAFYCAMGIFALSFFLIMKKVSPILMIALSAGLGILCGVVFRF